ncbi:sec-independent protein translocase protein TatB [Microbacterium sp. SORGH_AS 1204]|uniref:twin-arginine translocase TatA/TatE family subunit n=1 Tax=Microbacterium sp. SORGH_AS_1204 TaxID=3041785 RepID=UPI00278D142E|nr:twin-arginine translocase TatA/TatE family subunit [Microbacterium sp. SORGH_AS_1204]MDQ1135603.1 sec-independent protein translocase protein TatB [Microbacterium sp. SORGH_AS_1204]
MTFGLTIEKMLLIGLIAVMIIGPERLPAAAESLRRTIQQVRRMARTAQERMREELGPEVADVDWQRLDPRQYDPRRIIREALLAEPDAAPSATASATPPDATAAPDAAPVTVSAASPSIAARVVAPAAPPAEAVESIAPAPTGPPTHAAPPVADASSR